MWVQMRWPFISTLLHVQFGDCLLLLRAEPRGEGGLFVTRCGESVKRIAALSPFSSNPTNSNTYVPHFHTIYLITHTRFRISLNFEMFSRPKKISKLMYDNDRKQRSVFQKIPVTLGRFTNIPGAQVRNADFRQQMVHQSSLCYKERFDTAPFCCVIDRCQTRTSHNLEKCVRSVVLLCSSVKCSSVQVSKFVPNKEHSQTALILCFHSKETAAESHRLLRKLMVNVLHRKIRVNDGFGISKVTR